MSKAPALTSFDVRTLPQSGTGSNVVVFAQWKDDKTPEGFGMEGMEAATGKVYRGFYATGKFQGLGKLSSGTSFEYIGEFKSGKMDGLGRLKKKDNMILGRFNFESLNGFGITIQAEVEFKGGFQKGSLFGFGEIFDKAGNVEFKGFFKDGIFDKCGHEKSIEGEYFGNFSNGLKDGIGTLTTSGNKKEIYTGNWREDVKSGYGRVILPDGNTYEGQFKLGIWEGLGRIEYKSKGFTYTGSLLKGKRHGFGRLESDSYMFAGYWENDKKHGLGYQSVTSGATYFGEWSENQKSGQGYEIGLDFNYKGEWKLDKPHGRGMISTKGKPDQFAAFEMGTLIRVIKSQEVDAILERINSFGFDEFLEKAKNYLDNAEDKIDRELGKIDQELQRLRGEHQQEEATHKSKISSINEGFRALESQVNSTARMLDEYYLQWKGTVAKSKQAIQLREQQEKEKADKERRQAEILEQYISQPPKSSNNQANRDLGVENKTVGEIVEESKGFPKELVQRLQDKEAYLSKQESALKKLEKANQEHLRDVESRTAELQELEIKMQKEKDALESRKADEKKKRMTKNYSTEVQRQEGEQAVAKRMAAEADKLKLLSEELKNKDDEFAAKYNHLEEQIRKLTKELKEEKAKNQELEEIIRKLRAELAAKQKDQEAESRRQAQQIQELEKAVDVAKSKENEQLANLAVAQKSNSELEAKLNKLASGGDDSSSRIQDLKQQVESEKAKSASLEEHLKTAKEKDQTQVLQVKVKELEDEIAKLRQTSEADAQKQKAEHTQELAKMEVQLKALMAGGDEKLEMMLKAERKQIAELKDSLAKQEEKNTKQDTRIKELEAQLDKEKRQAAAEREQLRRKEAELEAKICELSEEQKSMQDKKKEWDSMKEALSQNIKALKDKEASLVAELAGKKNNEKEEIKKRSEKLSKAYFEQNEKCKKIFKAGRLPSFQKICISWKWVWTETIYFWVEKEQSRCKLQRRTPRP